MFPKFISGKVPLQVTIGGKTLLSVKTYGPHMFLQAKYLSFRKCLHLAPKFFPKFVNFGKNFGKTKYIFISFVRGLVLAA